MNLTKEFRLGTNGYFAATDEYLKEIKPILDAEFPHLVFNLVGERNEVILDLSILYHQYII
jgi:hypothetical protein